MIVWINSKNYYIKALEEIITKVPSEEIITLSIFNNYLGDLPENSLRNLLIHLINLKRLYLLSTGIKYLPENTFEYNINLERLELCHNMLTDLPENIFKNNNKLQELNLGINNLTNLPENIFQYNTNLQELNLHNNKFTNLPDDVFRYNTNLQRLYLGYNKLIKLPISLLNCNRLLDFNYCNNEIDYIAPNMQRFLNRLINQSNDLQIYNDGQNVHNHEIQESVKNSIDNILSIPKTIDRDKIMQYIVDSKLSETSKRLILEYCNDSTVHTVLNVTFEEVLLHMFQYIVDHLPDKQDNIIQILNTEMQDSECKCFTGRISRLINCLCGISDLVEIKIPENVDRNNIVVMLIKKYEGQELIDHITKEFTARGYQEHIQEYIEAL